MMPWPATSTEQTISWLSAAVGRLEGLQRVDRARGWLSSPRMCSAAGKCSSTRALDLAVVGEHDEPLARGAEIVDPGKRRVELATRGEQLQRVQAHQALGAKRRRDLRVELAQVERLAAKPRHEVALGEPVLGLVVELDRDDRARLRPAAAGARRASAGARSSARADASAGADGRRRRGSAAPNLAPEPNSSSRPRMRSWEISSAGRLITGVPVSASTKPSRGTSRASRCDGLRSLRRRRSCSSGTRRARAPAARARRAARAARRRCRS